MHCWINFVWFLKQKLKSKFLIVKEVFGLMVHHENEFQPGFKAKSFNKASGFVKNLEPVQPGIEK